MLCSADSLIEQYNEETKFFYASPMGSLRADGVLFHTAEVNEVANLLESAKGQDEQALVVGAIPFHASSKAQLIVPKKTVTGGSASPKQRAVTPVTTGAQLVTQFPSPDQFISNVDSAITLLKSKELRKVVLSRMIELRAKDDINIKELLLNLLSSNRLGRTFFLANPNVGDDSILIGASPEVILAKQGVRIRTNPLAGSIPRGSNPVDDLQRGKGLLRSQKDLYEHALVIEGIVEVLRPFCSVLDIPKSPTLLATPTMWHLSTRISATLVDPNMDSLTLARALHPTPAVCGYPSDLAMQSIKDLEGYDRELYSGLIGWMNCEGDGEWALAIRCAKISGRSMTLYAGAGIVEGSEPELELAETRAKLGTLSNALGIALH